MTPLADRLRTETRALHAAAERSAVMRALLRGTIGRDAYAALLRSLHTVYAALEPALLRHAADARLAPFALQALPRTRALQHDLRVVGGSSWRDASRPAPAAQRLARRIREVDAGSPGLLLAHAYVRYLGDLHGGQMLRRAVGANAALGGEDAVAFYDFGDPAAVAGLIAGLRAGLEATVAAPAEADALVDEARLAFRLHAELFDELAVAHALR